MKLNNKGTTLVEVTAGFLMLIVIMTSFIKIINLSSEMTNTATDMKTKNLAFEEEYYKGYNYKLTSGENNGQYAFRDYSSMLLKDKTGIVIPVTLTECQKDSSGEYISTGASTITLPGVNIFRIENVKDKSISRTSVFRYAKDYTDPNTVTSP